MITHWSRSPRPLTAAVSSAVTSVAVLSGVLAGCSGSSSPAVAGTARAEPPGITVPPGPAPRSGTADAGGKGAGGSCVDRVFSKLTTAQRVGQLFLVGMSGDSAGPATEAAERKYHFGSVLFAGNTSESAGQVAATTSYVQALAAKATGGVRFLVAANQEGGQVRNLRGPGFDAMPSALTQGSWPVSRLRRQAAAWGRELKSGGVNFDLAPVMDVVPSATANSNAPIGQLDREYGHSAATAGSRGTAFIDGMTAAGVATSAKHFPGLGRVTGNTDFTADVVDTVTTSSAADLATYRAAAAGGVPFMMTALATYQKIDPARMAAFSPAVTRLLRGPVGFRGVIISDDIGDARAVASIPPARRAVAFLDAGGDMITSQSFSPAEQMAPAVLAKTSSDQAFAAKVNAAVRLILAAKQRFGLLSC